MVFPEIAKCMACKKMYQTDLAKLLGVSQMSVSRKLNGKSEFTRSEMIKIKEHFKDVAPEVTMEKLFDIFLTA
jgi:predicted transcriptional regulator